MPRRFAAAALLAGAFVVGIPADAFEIQQIDLTTNDLLYDPFTDRIYATIPGRVAKIGNTVTVIDPATGALGGSVFVGSEPGKMAMSDDGQFLYVSLDGAAAVRRVRLPDLTPEIQFSLGSDSFFGPYYVEDIEVQPGNPNVIAVSRKNLGISPRHAGVAIYEDGVQRLDETPRHTGSNVIEFSDSPSTLYGYNNETTEFGFRTMDVTENGVTTTGVASDFISGFSVDIEFASGTIYSTTGVALDPTIPAIVGTYSGVGFGRTVLPEVSTNTVYFLPGSLLLSFRLDTFTLLDSLSVQGTSGQPSRLIGIGGGELAFRTSGSQVFFLRKSLPDEDGDGVVDTEDNCIGVSNPKQENNDGDEFGDACDPFPDDSDNLGACFLAHEDDQAQIADLEAQVTALLEQLADGDLDGVINDVDQCPGTPAGAVVDARGCSLPEYCEQWQSELVCLAGTWPNDQLRKLPICAWTGETCAPRFPLRIRRSRPGVVGSESMRRRSATAVDTDRAAHQDRNR